MNRLDTAKRSMIVGLLVEGMSVNSIVRTTGVSKVTILKLLGDLGKACSSYQYDVLVNLSAMVVQVDEVWSFCYSKQKNVPEEHRGKFGYGDVWTWTAVDADSKLIFSWHVGGRTEGDCRDFIDDVADRCPRRIQLSSDGLGSYKTAVRLAFGHDIDYGQIIKVFGVDAEGEKRYSPAECTACKTKAVIGDPLESQISTSYIERTNLTLRMGNRRFTRLTNAHSKKIQNHEASIALHLMYYNYARPHETLTRAAKVKTTPAMAAGVADHVWTIQEIVGLL